MSLFSQLCVTQASSLQWQIDRIMIAPVIRVATALLYEGMLEHHDIVRARSRQLGHQGARSMNVCHISRDWLLGFEKFNAKGAPCFQIFTSAFRSKLVFSFCSEAAVM